ncbi:hypothetical protein GGF46_004323 [Coemansia sp. RSA 552]|nr:hypothetical protein GGF46_004323 [Coemansia sp. RSA 552]
MPAMDFVAPARVGTYGYGGIHTTTMAAEVAALRKSHARHIQALLVDSARLTREARLSEGRRLSAEDELRKEKLRRRSAEHRLRGEEHQLLAAQAALEQAAYTATQVEKSAAAEIDAKLKKSAKKVAALEKRAAALKAENRRLQQMAARLPPPAAPSIPQLAAQHQYELAERGRHLLRKNSGQPVSESHKMRSFFHKTGSLFSRAAHQLSGQASNDDESIQVDDIIDMYVDQPRYRVNFWPH